MRESRSIGMSGGEFMMPGGSGRGPRSMVFSRLWSCACCCRILCFSVDICVRTATEWTRAYQWDTVGAMALNSNGSIPVSSEKFTTGLGARPLERIDPREEGREWGRGGDKGEARYILSCEYPIPLWAP